MGNIIIQAFLKYVEANPAVIEKLISQLIPALVEALVSHLHKTTVTA